MATKDRLDEIKTELGVLHDIAKRNDLTPSQRFAVGRCLSHLSWEVYDLSRPRGAAQ